ncbi:hypothetical protein PR202_ga16685 [Eleusine coracana subsp. coracana]|uniref:Uncharacterized protein n=1 Tax=Eleusine coracana subsp. coracana TaxID=191504 RepID=A0AAV5CNI6_ELECO|nr:hypothetical protein PR202_ga16685 [Eleusine coracana subsp. coracana]
MRRSSDMSIERSAHNDQLDSMDADLSSNSGEGAAHVMAPYPGQRKDAAVHSPDLCSFVAPTPPEFALLLPCGLTGCLRLQGASPVLVAPCRNHVDDGVGKENVEPTVRLESTDVDFPSETLDLTLGSDVEKADPGQAQISIPHEERINRLKRNLLLDYNDIKKTRSILNLNSPPSASRLARCKGWSQVSGNTWPFVGNALGGGVHG